MSARGGRGEVECLHEVGGGVECLHEVGEVGRGLYEASGVRLSVCARWVRWG